MDPAFAEPKSLVHTKRQVSASPVNSPHKLGKIGPKRKRTMEVTNTPIPVDRQPNAQAKHHSRTSVTFEDFQEGMNERARRNHLASVYCSYITWLKSMP